MNIMNDSQYNEIVDENINHDNNNSITIPIN